MSAICGILALDGGPARLHELDLMMSVLDRHGPDGKSTWHEDSIALGHQAMQIAPESADEVLPRWHAPSGTALAVEGRIDNRDELMAALGKPAARQPTDSDLLLAAYLDWGMAFIDRLAGEFAVALWDARERRLHCITDPMGIRPLYYVSFPGRFVAFATELAPLLRIIERPAIDERRLAMLGLSAMTTYLEPDRTCFESIRRIPAATVMTFDGPRTSSREYWRPDARQRLRFKSDGECAEAFQDVFAEAVVTRLRNTTPPAALLSGGLDSSTIVGMASRILAGSNRNLRTLSIVPEPSARGEVTDEKEWIELFRKVPGLEMEEVSAPGAGPFDHLEALVETGSLCSYGFQHFMYSALARAAKRNGCRVLLDGYGGELSASAYAEGYTSELFLHGQIGRMIAELSCAPPSGAPLARKFKSQVLRPLVPFRVLRWMNRHTKPDRAPSYPLRAEFIDDVLGQEAGEIVERLSRFLVTAPDHRENLARRILLARQDARQRSHAGFIGYEDLRFTYPYLDRRVLEFTLAVDGRFKHRKGESRRLIRLGSRGLIPDAVRNRTSKAPFCPDYHLRYARQKEQARRVLSEMAATSWLASLVDLGRVLSSLDKKEPYQRDDPMAVDHDAQFHVPYAMYLCYFLNHFRG